MKLFQQLLIAPAALGFIAPLAANADVTTAQFSDVEELSAGAFSSATKLSGKAVFTTGFEDTNGNTDNKLATEYNFQLDLNTSFTGEDNLYTGIETGNQGDLNMDSQVRTTYDNNGTVTETNELQVHSLYYQFPIGDFGVTAGPLLDQDDVISATTSIYSSAFRLAELPWGSIGTTGAGAAVEYIADNGWNGSFSIVSAGASNATVGAYTLEGNDIWTVALGYDGNNWGGGAVYTDNDNGVTNNTDTSIGLGAYFRPENLGNVSTISIVYDQFRDNDAVDDSNLLIGVDYILGPGTLSGAFQSADDSGTTTNNYEVYYNYPVNDNVAIQGGVFFEEVAAAGTDDTQGIVVETFFSF